MKIITLFEDFTIKEMIKQLANAGAAKVIVFVLIKLGD
jgi:predicted amidophosphoribosyltransferase